MLIYFLHWIELDSQEKDVKYLEVLHTQRVEKLK